MSVYRSVYYFYRVSDLLTRSARAMKAALNAGGLSKDLEELVAARLAYYINALDTDMKPALQSKIVSIKAFRDDSTTPVLERTTFDYDQLIAFIKTLNASYNVNANGEIINNRGVRVGYFEIIAEDTDGVPVDVTKRFFDRLDDSRASLSSRDS